MPAIPLLLPELPPVNVVPPVGPVGPMPPPANAPTILPEVVVSATRAILTGIGAALFPQPMGPARFDEAPTPLPPEQLDEVLVTAPRLPYPLSPLEPELQPFPTYIPFLVPTYVPNPDTGPGSAPAPFDPLAVPDIVATPSDLPDVWGRPVAEPAPTTTPYPLAPPLADPFADPFGNPFSEPEPLPESRPAPDRPAGPNPASPPVPVAPGTPFDPLPFMPGEPVRFTPPQPNLPTADPLADPFFTAFPQPNAELDPEEDPCDCKKKKEKKKKRKPRDVCYRGTYRQRAKGISYSRVEQIPCESGPAKKVSKRETDTFGRPVPNKRSTKRKKNWKDTVDEVFGRFLP